MRQDVRWISQTGQDIGDQGPAHKDGSPVCQDRETANQGFERYERCSCPVGNPREIEQGILLCEANLLTSRSSALMFLVRWSLPSDLVVKPAG
jgi:hypothetical protein